MLAHRRTILRQPTHPNMALGKTTALTYSLCKLRNSCIDENYLELYEKIKMDTFYCAVSGAIPMKDYGSGIVFPKEIIGGRRT